MAARREDRQLGVMAVTDLTIDREIIIDAPITVVWRTITEPGDIAQWFADRVELDLRVGGVGTLVFEDKATAKTVTAHLLIEAVEPPRRFAFRWSQPEGESPRRDNSVLVDFTLVPAGPEQTRLRVTETGLEHLAWTPDEQARYAESHRHGWAVHFGRLGALLGAVTE
jgi:uncharacterized protein YndB with AHSA1/START domain